MVGANGLGLQLADDNNRVRVRGYRLPQNPDGSPGMHIRLGLNQPYALFMSPTHAGISAGQQAGILLGDILYQINGAPNRYTSV
jgi:hypothetical protein